MENQKEYWWIMIQDKAKGKVERCIITLKRKFEIKEHPANLYFSNNVADVA